MSSTFKLTVDGTELFDGDMGEWTRTPPEFVKDRIKPGAKAEQWWKPVMIILTDTLIANRDVEVEILQSPPNEWTMRVTNT